MTAVLSGTAVIFLVIDKKITDMVKKPSSFAPQKVTLFSKKYKTGKDQKFFAISEVLHEIFYSGIGLDISNDDFFLVMDEAVTNAMEHGNRWKI